MISHQHGVELHFVALCVFVILVSNTICKALSSGTTVSRPTCVLPPTHHGTLQQHNCMSPTLEQGYGFRVHAAIEERGGSLKGILY